MKRTPLRTKKPLKAKPETTRAWQERGRAPLERKTEMPKRGPKYKARHAFQFASQADLCRHLRCCACEPWLYMEDLAALEFESEERISDPHHNRSRGAGGKDEDTVPLCVTCHMQCSAPGWSAKRVQDEAVVDFAVVAARLARYLAETKTAVEEAAKRPPRMYGAQG